MEVIWGDVDGGDLGVGDLDRLGVVVVVERAPDGEAVAGRGCADELNDHLTADERFAAPVLGDEGEEAMFDLVRFAGAGRVGGERNRQPGLIGKGLQLTFPQAHPRAVAAAAVRGDQQPGGGGIALPAEGEPPTPDALNREGGGIP